MSTPEDLSFVLEDIKPIPGFKMNLGKGTTEFDYIDGVALAPVNANGITRFLLKKPNGKEANIQISGDFPIKEGHFVSAVWAVNKATDNDYMVGFVNHTLKSTHISEAITYFPETTGRMKFASLAVWAVASLYVYFSFLSDAFLQVLNWIGAIIGGAVLGLVPISFVNQWLLKQTENKARKKLELFLSTILESRKK